MSKTATSTAEEAINGYITDMLALEEHIVTAVQGQQENLKKEHPMFSGVLKSIELKAMRHVDALKALVEAREIGVGGTISEVVKRAGSVVLGVGAAAIDLVRSERVPKNLRDDYTALALATIGYSMLFTTATSLGDTEVAALASLQHKDYATSSMELAHIVPASVLVFLADEGMEADTGVLDAVRTELDAHWRD